MLDFAVVPGCNAIMLEASVPAIPQERLKKGLTVIQNYGYGGSGVTLSWGCAGVIVELVSAAAAP
ncbi:hypothetical protein AB0E10_13795 [Streptomyces sp. NPDC048045]|uniref:hypothetical protein n=1 Tax=Streptomyces sp. NPDC048045 TaxID=3154710 RepID=UPI00344A5197